MATSTAFLAPHPPNLFHVTESQAFSSSSASLSTSPATPAFFDRLSRASTASAYLTDLAHPITPSHSNYDVEQRQGSRQSKPSGSKSDPAAPQESTPKDSQHHLIRYILELNEELGYRSDHELEERGFDAVDVLLRRLRRSEQTPISRQASKIMAMRESFPPPLQNDDGDQLVGTAPLAMEVVITEAQEDHVEDWSCDFELNMHQGSQVKSRALPDVGDSQSDNRSLIDGSITEISHAVTQPYDAPEVECNDSVHEPLLEQDVVDPPENVVFNPVLPSKPAIKPMDLDWECSPFSLCSPPRSSTNSTSHKLESPFQLEATGTISSPAIYNSSVFGSHSPSNSPLAAISSLMFSEHIRHMHGAPTGEDLSVADLLRLEISATRVQAESTPITQTSSNGRAMAGHGFEMPSPTSQLPIIVFQPSQHEAQDCLSPLFPSDGENVIDFENSLTGNSRHPSQSSQRGCRLEVPMAGHNRRELAPHVGTEELHMEVVEKKIISNERSDNSGREFVGLGFGGLAGGSLQSPGSISRLYLVPSSSGGKISGERAIEGSSLDNIFNGRYRSPGIKNLSEDISYPELSPSCIQLEAVDSSDFNLDHMSVSPLQTELLLQPPHEASLQENIAHELSDHNVNARTRPGIKQPHALLEEKRRVCRATRRVVPASCIGLAGAKSLALPTRYSSVYIGWSPTKSSPVLLTPENDPRSPCPPTEVYFSRGQENRGLSNAPRQNAGGRNSEDHGPFASSSAPVVSSVVSENECPKDPIPDPPRKSAESLGIGLPSDLANKQGGHENMTSAEGCMNLAQLACSPSPHRQRNLLEANTSFESSKDSIKAAMFTKCRLYDIPDFPSSPFVHETLAPPPAAPSSSRSRLLSPAWPKLNLFDRLSPSKSSRSWLSSSPASKACGPPAPTNTREGDRTRSPANISTLSLPPTSPAHKIRFPWMSRTSLSQSSFSILDSNSHPVECRSTSGVISPAVIEHKEAPRGFGLFKRNNSRPPPKTGRKENRFKPAIRKLQLLF